MGGSCFLLESSYFGELGALRNPTTTSSGVLNDGTNKKKRRRKKFKIFSSTDGVLAHGSAHARPSAQPPIDNSGNFPKLRNPTTTFYLISPFFVKKNPVKFQNSNLTDFLLIYFISYEPMQKLETT
jgi:hypothetical protein